jgi:hypothetical protein
MLAAEQGKLMLAASVASFLLVTSSFFRLRDGEELAYLLGYELPWSVAVMAGAIALGDGERSRQIRNAQQRQRERDGDRHRDAAHGAAEAGPQHGPDGAAGEQGHGEDAESDVIRAARACAFLHGLGIARSQPWWRSAAGWLPGM